MEKTITIHFVGGTVEEHVTHMYALENGTLKIALVMNTGRTMLRYYSLNSIFCFEVK